MESTCPAINADVPHQYFTADQARTPLEWLLELEADGTIRYSNIHPGATLADGGPVTGSNFFELPNIGDLSAFRSDFVGFVRGVKNRETFRLRTGSGVYDDSTVIVLTRSFDKTGTGPSSAVVLMELKRA